MSTVIAPTPQSPVGSVRYLAIALLLAGGAALLIGSILGQRLLQLLPALFGAEVRRIDQLDAGPEEIGRRAEEGDRAPVAARELHEAETVAMRVEP